MIGLCPASSSSVFKSVNPFVVGWCTLLKLFGGLALPLLAFGRNDLASLN